MNFGPIQLIAFAFESVDKFKGQIRHELDELRGRGMIRVIDLGLHPFHPLSRRSRESAQARCKTRRRRSSKLARPYI